jgi:hypothetical protein
MKLSDFATPLAAKDNFVKVSLGGFAGSGKSRTGAELVAGAYKHLECNKPVLFIDNEKGSRFLVPFFKDKGIEVFVKETIELADILQAFNLLSAGEISFLFIDSLTKVWYNYIAQYRQKQGNKKFMTLQDWGKILPAWQKDFSDVFVSVEGNVVFTGRGGYTYDMEQNEETKKKEFVKSGVKMKMAGETPFEPDLNIWMDIAQKIDKDGKPEIWREALILKDRSGLIDGKTFKNPVYGDFEPVVEYLVSVPKGEIAGASDTSNLAPKENPTYYENREKYQIEEDRIKAAGEVTGLGTSAADKKVKVQLLQAIFGTASITEILNQELIQLQKKRVEFEQECFNYNTAEDKNVWLIELIERKAAEAEEEKSDFDKLMDGDKK